MTWLSSPAHTRWLEQETDRLLEFARRSVDPDGGFGWLGDDGRLVAERGRPLWITCRMTHVFALGHQLGRPGCGPLVDHGVAALRGAFEDQWHGGWYAELGPEGPVRREKTAYEHAFVGLAGASATVAGRPGGRGPVAGSCWPRPWGSSPPGSGTRTPAWSSRSGTRSSRPSTAIAG